DLLVQFLPIRDDHEGPVSAEPPQHLLGKHDHREALAAALRVPEDAKATPIIPDLLHRLDSAVDPEHLMILGYELAQSAARILEQQEALDQVEEADWFASGTQQRLQGNAFRPVLYQALPRRETLKGCVAR